MRSTLFSLLLQVNAPLTEKTWGLGCVIFGRQTCEMAASKFTSLSEENITQSLNDKDSENTNKLTKHRPLILSRTSRRKTSEILQLQWS